MITVILIFISITVSIIHRDTIGDDFSEASVHVVMSNKILIFLFRLFLHGHQWGNDCSLPPPPLGRYYTWAPAGGGGGEYLPSPVGTVLVHGQP